ncbi:MAG TPA: SDR family oxidoreductase [Chitinophagaceae bacterium]|nr:SDR family oxidoreductase [Chitinophagaceae bacterium]
MPTVLILGATSDMALAIARTFAKNKYAVQLAARDTSRLTAFQTDLQLRHNVTCTLHAFDALQYNTHAAFFDQLPVKPEVTICVFGVMEDEELAYNDWSVAERMINSNFTGAVSILTVAAKYYQSVKSGCIAGISSVAGERGRQSKLIYGSSKAAFTAYLDGLRNKLFNDNVHVVTVKPGFVYTRMTESLQLPAVLTASPEEVGNAVYNAVQKKTNTVYVRWMWRWIMLIIRNIPEFQFKKMKL